MASPQYRASQIAAALNCQPRYVRDLLDGVPPDGHTSVKGQRAGTYRESSFPARLSEKLAQRLEDLRERGYHSVRQLLTHPPRAVNLVNLSDLTPEAVEEAEERRAVLAPLLAKRSSMAVAELTRRAHAAWLTEHATAPSLRTFTNWINRALDFDHGEEDFARLGLYISKQGAPVLASAEALESPLVREAVPKIEDKLIIEIRWQEAFKHADDLMARGADEKTAAKVAKKWLHDMLGGSDESIRVQWHKKRARHLNGEGANATKDQRKENQGRPCKFNLTKDETKALQHIRLQKGSLALAVEFFARDPRCLPTTRTLISDELDRAARLRIEPNWPISIRRAGYVSDDENAHFQGPKAAQEYEYGARRGMTWEDENGNVHVVRPNTIWESDDMSLNEPFTWRDSETGMPLIGRQTLCTQDVFSGSWLGATTLGRERDAYRAEDIADHMAAVVAAHGLPLFWRLERGRWENTFIDGVRVIDGGRETRWGSLDDIIRIVRVFKSRGKGGIETGFNFLQDLIAHESIHIGRTRGEFEAATKHMLRAQNGNEQSAAKFWSIDAAGDGLRHAMQLFNARPKKRRAFGRQLVVPDDLYQTLAHKRECPSDQLWRFLPAKRAATIRQGCLEMTVNHYPLPFRFRVNGHEGLYFEHGTAVLVAFHPGHPERGAHVFNGEPQSSARNRDGLRLGEFLCLAPMAEDAPQFNLAPTKGEFSARRAANAAVRSSFRAIVPTGRTGARTSTVRDGYGQSAVIERGSNPVPMIRSATDLRREVGENLKEKARAKEPKKAPFDEAEELARLERAELAAIERGELLLAPNFTRGFLTERA